MCTVLKHGACVAKEKWWLRYPGCYVSIAVERHFLDWKKVDLGNAYLNRNRGISQNEPLDSSRLSN